MSGGALLDESVFEIISDACRELKKPFIFHLVQYLELMQ